MRVTVTWVQSVKGAGEEEQSPRRCCFQAFSHHEQMSWNTGYTDLNFKSTILLLDKVSPWLWLFSHSKLLGSCRGGKETLDIPLESIPDLVLPLRNEGQLLSSPALHQTSPDRILLLHQVERFGLWHIGIWLLIYLLSLCDTNGILQLEAHTHTHMHTSFIKSLSSIDLGQCIQVSSVKPVIHWVILLFLITLEENSSAWMDETANDGPSSDISLHSGDSEPCRMEVFLRADSMWCRLSQRPPAARRAWMTSPQISEN